MRLRRKSLAATAITGLVIAFSGSPASAAVTTAVTADATGGATASASANATLSAGVVVPVTIGGGSTTLKKTTIGPVQVAEQKVTLPGIQAGTGTNLVLSAYGGAWAAASATPGSNTSARVDVALAPPVVTLDKTLPCLGVTTLSTNLVVTVSATSTSGAEAAVKAATNAAANTGASIAVNVGQNQVAAHSVALAQALGNLGTGYDVNPALPGYQIHKVIEFPVSTGYELCEADVVVEPVVEVVAQVEAEADATATAAAEFVAKL